MTGDEIASYLQAHPEFFEEHSELLAHIQVPHPHEDRAIPLAERQLQQLRERVKVLESKLRELVSFGEENDTISERLHRTTLALMKAASLEDVLHTLYFNLREDFSVPHIAVRLWGGFSRELPECAPVGEETRVFAESLTSAYCSHKAMFDSASWFGEQAPGLRSFAYVSLRETGVQGVLALASEDPQRFYPEMGTLYLQRLGELTAAAIARQSA